MLRVFLVIPDSISSLQGQLRSVLEDSTSVDRCGICATGRYRL